MLQLLKRAVLRAPAARVLPRAARQHSELLLLAARAAQLLPPRARTLHAAAGGVWRGAATTQEVAQEGCGLQPLYPFELLLLAIKCDAGGKPLPAVVLDNKNIMALLQGHPLLRRPPVPSGAPGEAAGGDLDVPRSAALVEANQQAVMRLLRVLLKDCPDVLRCCCAAGPDASHQQRQHITSASGSRSGSATSACSGSSSSPCACHRPRGRGLRKTGAPAAKGTCPCISLRA